MVQDSRSGGVAVGPSTGVSTAAMLTGQMCEVRGVIWTATMRQHGYGVTLKQDSCSAMDVLECATKSGA